MTSKDLKHLLTGLGYPHADTFSLADRASFQELIFQLEDKYIRSYATEDRTYLLSTASHWDEAFTQYLADVGCPVVFQRDQNEEEVLEWLLQLAVGLAYEDLVAEGNDDGSRREGTSTSGASFPDWKSPDTQASVQRLLQLSHIRPTSSSSAEQLRVAKEVIKEQLLPIVGGRESQLGQQENLQAQPKSTLDPGSLSLGFTTHDPQVDAAATVMRLLFIKDLRALQTSIDDAIVEVQEFTQNPRANTKLGVVGR